MCPKLVRRAGWLALAALLLGPAAGRAQFRPPPGSTIPPGYRSGTLPPGYRSSTLPPRYPRPRRSYHPSYYEPTAPPTETPEETRPGPWWLPPAFRRPTPREEERVAPGYMAVITAHVPAGAELWFDGVKVTGAGPERHFRSPPLQPGLPYAYTVEARWREDGHEVRQSRRLRVRAGTHVEVSFPLAPR